MKQGQGSKRVRGRSSGRRGGNRQQLFDSNGPSVRIRGNAFQVHEKYLGLARDAASSGDRIAAENYYQHAEHYFRIHSSDQEERARQQANGQNGDGQPRRSGRQPRQGTQSAGNGASRGDAADQPNVIEAPVEAANAEPDTDGAEPDTGSPEEGVLRTLQVGDNTTEKSTGEETPPKANGQDAAAAD